MSENNLLKPLKCPNCKQELEMIIGEEIHAVYDLRFSKKRGIYVPYLAVLAAESFVCSLCNKELPESLFKSKIAENLAAVKLSKHQNAFLVETRVRR